MKPQEKTEEQISLRAFPFSLADKPMDWLYYLPSGTITTWENMKQQFLEKLIPASRASNIMKDICGIRQLQMENLYEYWERFKKLCDNCPQHHIPEQLLVQYFYEGLSIFDRIMIDAASGGQVQYAKDCGICAIFGHSRDMCLHYKKIPHNKLMQSTDFLDNLSAGMSLDEIGKALAENTQKFQQETRASIQNLSTQLEAQNLSNLPSQTVVNPNEYVSAITLRNCKELEVHEIGVQASSKKNEENDIKVEDKIINQNDAPKYKFSPLFKYKPIPPFPLSSNRKCESIKELNDTFRRGEVNIPSLDAIKPVPPCAKFLKELCTTQKRHKLKVCNKENVGEHVCAVIQKTIPIKYSDPSMFSILCTIGNTRLEKAMLDFGASINVMPDSVYNYLELGPLTKTSIAIQLAERSTIYPRGVIEICSCES
ncbi:uncharacterized protein [Primulina eburnea]|uniref:uncharacterized protein n=1 Tax=Primulina eburnea TaxID=1245227 RepID=UPI003C6CAEFF